jgi:dihydropteroate synthase
MASTDIKLIRGNLAGIKVGDGEPVRIAGVINVSPESFYKGSVVSKENEIIQQAERMVADGADMLDVGGMSTAPYKETRISEKEEAERVTAAIRAIKEVVDVPVSIDTQRAYPAEQGLKAGADLINDVSGFKIDPDLPKIVSDWSVPAILMAWETENRDGSPMERVKKALEESLQIAEKFEINDVAIDPGIGFFREKGIPWYKWDALILKNLTDLRELEKPVYVGVSRKSFIGKILGKDRPEDRLIGSLAATVVAVINGAHLIRTHDVAETLEAVRIAQFIKDIES